MGRRVEFLMNIAIIGENSLADATAQCCSDHFTVARVPNSETNIVWICCDTPVLEDFQPDVATVLEAIAAALKTATPGTLVIVSSQLPVGTTKHLELTHPDFVFAHSPENIRVATAVEDFKYQARIIVGIRSNNVGHLNRIQALFRPFTNHIMLTTPETAECVKHALNGFLALQIAYINEIAAICAQVGADPLQVSQALKSDPRVSPKAPLKPGSPYGGGHLEREIWNLNALATAYGLNLPLIANIQRSNERT